MALNFQPLHIEDLSTFRSFMPNGGRVCDQAFTNLFCWQNFYETQWTVVEDRFVIRCKIYGERRIGYMILPDIYSERLPIIIDQLKKQPECSSLTLINLSKEETEWLRQEQPDLWGFDHNRDYDDYLYETEKFKAYRGKKLAAKRNHVNKFNGLYQYRYETLTPELFEACLRLEQSWHIARGDDSNQEEAEQLVIRKAFEHYTELGIIGGVLLVDETPVAFTYGSPLNDQTICVHIEKADTSYEGVYPMIAQLFAQHLPAQYIYLDREEDLGLPGLRKSKESYQPSQMGEKHTAFLLNATHREILKVWTTCFGDEPEFIHSFLSRHYCMDTAFLHRENGQVVATCFAIVCDTEIGQIGYLYAIATLPEYRKQGIAEALVKQAIDFCRDKQLAAAALIPADEHLTEYYIRLGFQPKSSHLHFNSSLDLGTGNTEQDNALLFPLKSGLQIPQSLNCNPLM
ncbi:MAG: GNAT family N-acetyltransferase [Bacteroidales bacterium]|nr:GNAT family N-acetyltransferase [Bacteroidales bacterium]